MADAEAVAEMYTCQMCSTGKMVNRSVTYPCLHYFCYACIHQWTETHKPFPVCPVQFCGNVVEGFSHSAGAQYFTVKNESSSSRRVVRKKGNRKPKNQQGE